jgi:hypothetical protein
MSGGERSSIGDRWALDVKEEGADGVSSSPRSEVGASHRTAPVPALHRRSSPTEKAKLAGTVASSGSTVDLHDNARSST